MEREKDSEIKRKCRLLGLSETAWSKIAHDNHTFKPSIWMYRFQDNADLTLLFHARERGIVTTTTKRTSHDGDSRFDLLAKIVKTSGAR